VILKLLEVVEVLQYIEVVRLLQNLFVSLHRRNGLAVYKDLADVDSTSSGGFLQAVDLEMELEEKKLLVAQPQSAPPRGGLVLVVDAARNLLEQLILYDLGEQSPQGADPLCRAPFNFGE